MPPDGFVSYRQFVETFKSVPIPKVSSHDGGRLAQGKYTRLWDIMAKARQRFVESTLIPGKNRLKSTEDARVGILAACKMNDYDEALHHANLGLLAAHDNSTMFEAFLNRGKLTYLHDEYDASVTNFRMALDVVGPDDDKKGEVYGLMGYAFHDSGKLHEAVASLRAALPLMASSRIGKVFDNTDIYTMMNLCQKYIDESPEETEVGKMSQSTQAPVRPIVGSQKGPLIYSLGDEYTIKFTEHDRPYLAAGRVLNPGELLLFEKPFVSTLSSRDGKAFMHYCGECGDDCYLTFVPCESCDQIVYCSKRCREADRIHKIECPILGSLRSDDLDLEISDNMTLVFRSILKLTPELWGTRLRELVGGRALAPTLIKHLLETYENNPRNCGEEDVPKLYHVAHFLLNDGSYSSLDPRVDEKDECTLRAIYLMNLLKRTPYWDSVREWCSQDKEQVSGVCEEEELDKFLGEIMCRLALTMNRRAVDIVEMIDDSGTANSNGFLTRRKMGKGFYPMTSLISHSCNPNCVRFSMGLSTAVFILRPVKAGEPLTLSYGHPYYEQTKKTRRAHLTKQFGFTCECEACIYNWPTSSKKHSDILRSFHCPRCGGTGFATSKNVCQNCSANYSHDIMILKGLIEEYEAGEKRKLHREHMFEIAKGIIGLMNRFVPKFGHKDSGYARKFEKFLISFEKKFLPAIAGANIRADKLEEEVEAMAEEEKEEEKVEKVQRVPDPTWLAEIETSRVVGKKKMRKERKIEKALIRKKVNANGKDGKVEKIQEEVQGSVERVVQEVNKKKKESVTEEIRKEIKGKKKEKTVEQVAQEVKGQNKENAVQQIKEIEGKKSKNALENREQELKGKSKLDAVEQIQDELKGQKNENAIENREQELKGKNKLDAVEQIQDELKGQKNKNAIENREQELKGKNKLNPVEHIQDELKGQKNKNAIENREQELAGKNKLNAVEQIQDEIEDKKKESDVGQVQEELKEKKEDAVDHVEQELKGKDKEDANEEIWELKGKKKKRCVERIQKEMNGKKNENAMKNGDHIVNGKKKIAVEHTKVEMKEKKNEKTVKHIEQKKEIEQTQEKIKENAVERISGKMAGKEKSAIEHTEEEIERKKESPVEQIEKIMVKKPVGTMEHIEEGIMGEEQKTIGHTEKHVQDYQRDIIETDEKKDKTMDEHEVCETGNEKKVEEKVASVEGTRVGDRIVKNNENMGAGEETKEEVDSKAEAWNEVKGREFGRKRNTRKNYEVKNQGWADRKNENPRNKENAYGRSRPEKPVAAGRSMKVPTSHAVVKDELIRKTEERGREKVLGTEEGKLKRREAWGKRYTLGFGRPKKSCGMIAAQPVVVVPVHTWASIVCRNPPRI